MHSNLFAAAAAAAKSLQSCPTQCNPVDASPPGSSVPGILQARTLEWIATAFSRKCAKGTKWSRRFPLHLLSSQIKKKCKKYFQVMQYMI